MSVQTWTRIVQRPNLKSLVHCALCKEVCLIIYDIQYANVKTFGQIANFKKNLMVTVQNIHNRKACSGEEECLNNRTFFRSPRDPLSPFSLVCWMQAHLWLQLPYSPEHSFFFFQFSCSFSSLWNWACSKSSCKSNVGNLERQSASNHNHL